jgi:hypothetical protein
VTCSMASARARASVSVIGIAFMALRTTVL